MSQCSLNAHLEHRHLSRQTSHSKLSQMSRSHQTLFMLIKQKHNVYISRHTKIVTNVPKPLNILYGHWIDTDITVKMSQDTQKISQMSRKQYPLIESSPLCEIEWLIELMV